MKAIDICPQRATEIFQGTPKQPENPHNQVCTLCSCVRTGPVQGQGHSRTALDRAIGLCRTILAGIGLFCISKYQNTEYRDP